MQMWVVPSREMGQQLDSADIEKEAREGQN